MSESIPTVSAIVVFLNAEPYLRDAIESIVAQTYEDWELILVDDGSTDGSTAIAKDLAECRPRRVTYLEHEGHQNRGISASRNRGIQEARGEFIATLDADDLWLPDKLAEQVELMKSHADVAMVYGSTRYWFSWNTDRSGSDTDFQPVLGFPSAVPVVPRRMLVRMLLGGGAVPCTSSIMMRTDRVRAIGGFEESFTGMYEDQAFYTKLFLRYPVLPVNRCWDLYRQHEGSVCSTSERTGTALEARRKFLRWVATYVAGSGTGFPAVAGAVRKAKWSLDHPRLASLARRARRLFA